MSDRFVYTNRRGDKYYLQSKVGEEGKLKYGLARKLTGSPVPSLPEGYETRELLESGQVVVRKIKPSAIYREEKNLLEKMIREQKKNLLFIVDLDERSLVSIHRKWMPMRGSGQRSAAFGSGEKVCAAFE